MTRSQLQANVTLLRDSIFNRLGQSKHSVWLIILRHLLNHPKLKHVIFSCFCDTSVCQLLFASATNWSRSCCVSSFSGWFADSIESCVVLTSSFHFIKLVLSMCGDKVHRKVGDGAALLNKLFSLLFSHTFSYISIRLMMAMLGFFCDSSLFASLVRSPTHWSMCQQSLWKR